MSARGALAKGVHWEVRFRSSGRRDLRDGGGAAALEGMRPAALSTDFTLKASAG